MYLSKVFLHPGKLNNAYEWHRAIWSLFPGFEPGEVSPFLYAMESMNLARGASLLVQSSVEPVVKSDVAIVGASKPTNALLPTGQLLGFRLMANPTRCIEDKEAKSGKKNRGKCRVPLIREEEQIAWLQRRLGDAADVREVKVTRNSPVYFRKGSRAGKIVPVTFEGVVEVRDPVDMREMCRKGIGPAKAFGCGMMLVRRV